MRWDIKPPKPKKVIPYTTPWKRKFLWWPREIDFYESKYSEGEPYDTKSYKKKVWLEFAWRRQSCYMNFGGVTFYLYDHWQGGKKPQG